MSRASWRIPAVLVVMTGCGRGHPAVTASWTGADTGALVASAVATWCPGQRLLEITAIRGDSGLSLVAYPAASWSAGIFPLFDPLTDSTRRPSAAMAVRWVTLDQVVGYRSVGGVARLARVNGTVSGTVSGRMLRSGSVSNTLAVELHFPAVPLDSAVGSCPPDSGHVAPPPGAAGVP